MTEDKETFYVIVEKLDKEIVSHRVTPQKPTPESLAAIKENKGSRKTDKSQSNDDNEIPPSLKSFESVLNDFTSMMKTYSNMIPMALSITPSLANHIANKALGEFVRSKGNSITELCSEFFDVYSVDESNYGQLSRRLNEANAAMKGATHLSEIAVIGLISVYDAYLSKLLKMIFELNTKLIFDSERNIKFSDLLQLGSIEEAKAQIVEKEVEGVLRESHHGQFEWMEKKFKLPLTKNLEVWPKFIELCERRNLLTHTGGHISAQYIKVCKDHKYEVSEPLGTKLYTGPKYFEEAVAIISEIGIKLGHTLWRKLNPDERADADNHLNEIGLGYIRSRNYPLAKSILDLGVNLPKHHSDFNRRMLVINFANAHKLGGDAAEAKSILSHHDWTATSTDFQICVAAVRDDMPAIVAHMKEIGATGKITKSDYRDWPVFRKIRSKKEFQDCFAEIFGEPILIEPQKVEIPSNSETASEPLEDGSAGVGIEPDTVH